MELRELLVTPRKGWIFILAMVVLGAGAAVLFVVLSPKTYQASTQLFVSASVPTTDSNGTAGAALAAGNTFTQDRVQSYVQIANSPRAMSLALKSPDDFNDKVTAAQADIAAAPAAKTAADAALTAANSDRDAKAAAAAAAAGNDSLNAAEKAAAQEAATAAQTAADNAASAAATADAAQERSEQTLAELQQQQAIYRKVQALGLTAADLARKVDVTAAKDTVLMNVTVQDGDAETAALLAGVVGNAISQFIESTDVTTSTGGGQGRNTESNVTITTTRDPAVPQKPASPNQLLDLAVGLLLGLVVGVGVVFLRSALDNTVKTAQDIDALGVPVLGFVPTDKRADRSPIAFRADAHSPRSEAYRSIRTNMQFLDVDNPPRVISVTSAVPAEGKSTTAINLAAALAEAGFRVCLVDADLRRPSVGATLGLVNDVGLTSVIVGDLPVEDVLQNAGRNLAVLTSGKIPPNPSELLLSSHARSIIADLAARVDFVIIDTPPLLPVTDAAELATVVDATVLVHRWGKTTREQASRSVSALSKVGTKPVGVIINMVNPGRGKSPDAYGYYYTYRPTQRKDRRGKDTPAVEEATPATTEETTADATAASPDEATEPTIVESPAESLVGGGDGSSRHDSG